MKKHKCTECGIVHDYYCPDCKKIFQLEESGFKYSTFYNYNGIFKVRCKKCTIKFKRKGEKEE